MNPTLGFIGLGNMGHPMATRLRDAHPTLIVQDVRLEHAQVFAGGSNAVATSPRELADQVDSVS